MTSALDRVVTPLPIQAEEFRSPRQSSACLGGLHTLECRLLFQMLYYLFKHMQSTIVTGWL